MLLASFLYPIVLYPLAAACDPDGSSICPSHPTSSFDGSDWRCGRSGLPGDHDQESLSLLQVGAKRLQKAAAVAKAAATKSAPNVPVKVMTKEGGAHAHPSAAVDQFSPMPAALGSNRSSPAAFVQMLIATTVTVARQGQGRVEALLKEARAGNSYALAIFIVAVCGIVALTLLAAIQAGHFNTSRNIPLQRSISQNFPRVSQSGPYGRPGGPGAAHYPAPDSYKVPGYNPYSAGLADARPSFQDSFMSSPGGPYQTGQPPTAPDSLQGSMPGLPDHSQHRSLPRVSMPAAGSPGALSLPRVQGPGARPASSSRHGSGMNLAPRKLDAVEASQGGSSMLPVPDVHRPPEVTGSAPRRPPPLCPMLVLPHCESFFSVPVDQLVAGTSTVEILGLSGNALLRSTVKDTEEGRVIEVSMSPPRSPALASISEAPSSGPQAGCRHLKGSRGRYYGWLRPTTSGYVLRCGEDDVMTVMTSRSTGQLQLYAGSSGDMLAQASRSGDGEGIFAAEDLEVRVTPGMDAVLAILCVISAALFAEGSTPFTFRRMA